MHTKFLLLISLIAVLAGSAVAQPTAEPVSKAVLLDFGNRTHDPLGILDDDEEVGEEKRRSGVKSSVIVNMTAFERTTFNLVNEKRVASGLNPLVWNGELAEIARLHSQNMAEFNFFSHRGLDNKLVSDRADARNLGRWRSIGENIAFNRGFGNPTAQAVDMWLGSASHRRNMLDAGWRESAIGVAVAGDGSYYFTQVFLVRR